MLLFNYTPTSAQKFKDKFQNISCYCLTDRGYCGQAWKIISKHLMLLFNFSKLSPETQKFIDFKTSHVIV